MTKKNLLIYYEWLKKGFLRETIMYFNPSQISLAGKAFAHAEKLAGRYYRLGDANLNDLRYDVNTLAGLEEHEVNENALAHICRYH
ncbi:MAG: hypothetical protein Q8O44_04310 [Syntrophales bacterium]|nr:hypothetical protein [Syntrophales bacterium]